jgi:hypothetical protein
VGTKPLLDRIIILFMAACVQWQRMEKAFLPAWDMQQQFGKRFLASASKFQHN